ncbi:MAG: TetR/AcrR family transcriptional regulator [Alphaproteobacteria bacterium]|nr:TetR/AcrR family transcriptional regulator [Alphaproteobacteria bacterium]MBU1515025.1 TetR/AcrR family transcriptional regulator [Alphaproteobacteria bacterium]MBU2095674.1 TetR/AcrR family transcriptional regulator [Alphaproteobacteria bacterium]MBU2151022.1 TetR/AcrR family transcriptional regulator [Alphaproteobacteria bacterium]MBU2306885.1 TetR/AcrR family transcriptional regulator [Alphaproteobacteria bacterium]
MARLAGQIDVSKNEAILDAAIEVMAERGLGASMDEIARRAGVSKQTIYNHYGSKAELARAMSERRAHEVSAVLAAPGAVDRPEEALAAYARLLMHAVLNTRGMAVYRMAMLSAPELPDVARAIYEAGPKASRQHLADFLSLENAAGRLDAPDPLEAAEFFAGMVLGRYQTPNLLGIPIHLDDAEIDRVAKEATARFMRAYAP